MNGHANLTKAFMIYGLFAGLIDEEKIYDATKKVNFLVFEYALEAFIRQWNKLAPGLSRPHNVYVTG